MKKHRFISPMRRTIESVLPTFAPGIAVSIDSDGVIAEITQQEFDKQFCAQHGIEMPQGRQ